MGDLLFLIQFFIYLIVGFAFVGPVSALIHELGHASLLLLVTGQNVTIQLGRHGKRLSHQFGRLTIVCYMEFGANFGIYYLEKDKWDKIPLTQLIWVQLGGPIASLLLFIVFGSLTVWTKWSVPLYIIFACVNFLLTLFTTFPCQYPKWTGVMAGLPNDVLSAWRLIQQMRREP